MYRFRSPASQYERAHHRGMSWLIGGLFRDAVIGPDAPRWFELSGDPQTQLIKKGDGRQVWRVRVGGETLYVKVYESRGLHDRVMRWLGLGRAAREWRKLTEAWRRNLAVPEPVALGESRLKKSACVLLTRAIRGATPLTSYWQSIEPSHPGRRGSPATHSLIRCIAALFAQAHKAGCLHRDAHPANLVVSRDPAEAFQAWFVDLLGAKFRGHSLSKAEAAQSLAQLDQYFHRVASRPDRLRFLASYMTERSDRRWAGAECDALRGFACAVLAARKDHARRLARQWDRRLAREGKYFGAVRSAGGWRGRVVLQLARRHVFPEPTVVDREAESWNDTIEALTQRSQHDGLRGGTSTYEDLVVEWQQASGFMQRWRWAFFGSPARRLFFASHRRRHRDEPGPLILGYLECFRAGLVNATGVIRPKESQNV